MTSIHHKATAVLVWALVCGPVPATAQRLSERAAGTAAVTLPNGVELPADYVIGPEDVLGVLFWREEDISGDVTVRPDGRITLPLLGDMAAAGLSPAVLKNRLEEAASQYLTEPVATIVVREVNSRKVYITGEVAKPGAYPLAGPRTVMQLIAMAGGLNEYADKNAIRVMRLENGRQVSYPFRYHDVARGRALPQNILLQPGDTVVVP
jgi:polysaccharide export outer membrane protein